MMRYAQEAMKKHKPKQISMERKLMHQLAIEALRPTEEALKPNVKKRLENILSELKVKVILKFLLYIDHDCK